MVGNSSASQFPQDAVARWRRHRRRRLLGREVWGWSKEVRQRRAAAASSGGRERKPPPPADLRETFHALRRRCVLPRSRHTSRSDCCFCTTVSLMSVRETNRTTENICMTPDAPETQTLQTLNRQSTLSWNFCKVLCFVEFFYVLEGTAIVPGSGHVWLNVSINHSNANIQIGHENNVMFRIFISQGILRHLTY